MKPDAIANMGNPGWVFQLLLVISLLSLLYSLYILRLWVVGCIPGPNSKPRIYIFTLNFQYSLKVRKISKNIDPVNPVHVIPVYIARGPSVSAPASSALKKQRPATTRLVVEERIDQQKETQQGPKASQLVHSSC